MCGLPLGYTAIPGTISAMLEDVDGFILGADRAAGTTRASGGVIGTVGIVA